MENQIVLTGKEAKDYQYLKRRIKDVVVDKCISGDLIPMIKTPFELMAELHEIQAHVMEAAIWLGIIPGLANTSLEKAKEKVQNAIASFSSGSDVSARVYHLKVISELLEAIHWYTTD